MQARLADRRVLVVGGARGIGAASCRRVAAEGASVMVADLRIADAEVVAEDVRALGGVGRGVAVDVTDEASVRAATDTAVEVMGGLDAVVCSVGIVDGAPTDELTIDRWDQVLRVNLTGTFLVVKHALAHLVAGGGGSVVTVGSVASVVSAGAAASYDASKAGVLGLTRSVARAYGDRNVRANCLCPGAVRTDIFANSTESLGLTPARGGMTVDPPISRYADPTELAAVVAFLVSDDSSFMTGTALMADGGFTAI